MGGAITTTHVLGLVLSIAIILAVLKIPAILREQQKTNKLIAKIASGQGVPETEIEKALH